MSEKIFVSADHHFGHKNILKYQPTTRLFDNVEEMNEQLVERHNARVGKHDKVYMLGDFCFGSTQKAESYLKRMNGRKYFIFGNHDAAMKKGHMSNHFEWMKMYAEIKVDGKSIVLFHFPIFSWNRMHHKAYHFYGHTHGQIPHLYHGRAMDVGVDTNDCYPWNVRDIFEMFAKVEAESDAEDFHDDPRGRDEKR